jgi:hypothetical protein
MVRHQNFFTFDIINWGRIHGQLANQTDLWDALVQLQASIGNNYVMVNTWADLPVDPVIPSIASVYLVLNATGIIFINRKNSGLWLRVNNTGNRNSDWQFLTKWIEAFSDSYYQFYNAVDPTKLLKLDLSEIGHGEQRTLYMPDHDVDLGAISGGTDNIIPETLTGTIDGTNRVFTTTNNINKILVVFINGIRESNYTKTGANEITFADAPKNVGFTDELSIIYIKV